MKKFQPIPGWLSDFPFPRFRRNLLTWYDAHHRDLPWRATRDPYRVWLSEIMLQQTRVAAVIEHYHEFLRRFPTIGKLASARESSVLAAWSGLGYYRRARMLHAAAKVIVREHDGKFPRTAEGLRVLPGIGRYTSAAIASIAFDEPVPVVDGNVERVLQRVAGKRLSAEPLWKAADQFLDKPRSGDFNHDPLAALPGEERTPLHGGYPRRACPSPVKHLTRRCAGHSAGRMMPKPPGNGPYPPARGHRTRSAFGSTLGRRRPSLSEIRIPL